MKYFLTLILLVTLMSYLNYPQNIELNLMPMPENITAGSGIFKLDTSFTISVKGNPDERIYTAASRTLKRLSGRTGIFFKQDFVTKNSTSDTSQLIITVTRPGKIELNEDESYQLKITNDKIELTAETDLGAMHGMETFLQLLNAGADGYYFPAIEINDKPRFPWRGLMIDACRHWMPVEVIKRNLDGMAALKLNVFHWHLSEDQGFRVESKVFPRLHELGSDGFYYTQNQIKDIINYAAERGIRVIPEFDIPGHTTSWFVGYPELASAPGPYTIERNWGIMDPAFDPTKETAYEFLDKFLGEMAPLFPDEYFHIGGDEVNGKQWDANESIQQFMKENNIADNHELQTYFNNRILEILTKHGKKMVGWDEILQPGMPNNIVIQSWRGTEALVEAAKEGYMGILSNGYYIDLIQSAEFHYLNDPIPEGSPLNEEEKKNILGGEATSWSELVTPENVDSRIWPRTAAIAERLWSPAYVRNVEDMYRRLELISCQLEELGLTHIKNYEMMLRRLTNYNDIIFLKTFVDVIEPVKIYTRHRQGVKYTSYSPYTRVVDAARPESKTARHFNKLVDGFIFGDKEAAKEINFWLGLWKNNHPLLVGIINQSPILKEIEPMSSNLSNISDAGIEAVAYIQNNRKTNNEWLNEKLSLIEEAKKPYGQAEIMITASIEKLIKAAAI